MKTFAVAGNPIAHSRSPDIHRAFAAQTDIALDYGRIEPPVTADGSGFVAAARAFFAAGGAGMNVTAPFKETAFEKANTASERSRLAMAANTLSPAGKSGWRADNTDGVGLVRDLTVRLRLPLAGARLLILGAGGATAGILAPLLDAHPAALALWNRSPDKAQRLVARFSRQPGGNALFALPAGEVRDAAPFDLILHATSLRTAPASWPWPRLPFSADTFFYDLGYADAGETPFLAWARAQGGRRMSDGFGMLVEQAAASFHLWHGVFPDTASVYRALRA